MESKYRGWLFVVLLVVQFLVISFIFFLWFTKAFSNNQLMDLLYLIVPLLTAHIVPAFDYFSDDDGSTKQQDPPKVMQRISFIIPVVYLLYMIVILLKGASDLSFQSLKQFIGVGEILFGFYIGLIVTKIFSNK